MFLENRKSIKLFLLFLLFSVSLFAKLINLDKKYPDFNFDKVEINKNLIGDGTFKTVYKGFFNGEKRAFVFFNKNPLSKIFFDENLKFYEKYEHENIAKAFAYSNEKKCIIFEKGKDLRDYLVENNLKLKNKLKIIKDVCLGLKYLHDNNIIHRDFKIENIILFKDELGLKAKIIDFDFYLDDVSEQGVKENFILGSFFNIHPLLYKDPIFSKSKEIYSLGVFIYILLLEEDFFYLFEDFLGKQVVQDAEEVIPIISDLELIDCYSNKDYIGFVSDYISRLKNPFLESILLYCIFDEKPEIDIVIKILDSVLEAIL